MGDERQIDCRGYARAADLRGYLANTFVGTKEKHFVFEDRSADHAPVLVAVQRVFRSVILVSEKVCGFQHGIAQILEYRAMKLVATALGHDAHLSARPTSHLSLPHTIPHSNPLTHALHPPA